MNFISITHLRNLVYLKNNTSLCGQAQKKKYMQRLTQIVHTNCLLGIYSLAKIKIVTYLLSMSSCECDFSSFFCVILIF